MPLMKSKKIGEKLTKFNLSLVLYFEKNDFCSLFSNKVSLCHFNLDTFFGA